MKISASIYSHKFSPLDTLVRELDLYKVDYFHIDMNDDKKILNDISTINSISKTPIDLHIISNNPQKYFDDIENLNIDRFCIQVEELNSHFSIDRKFKSKVGLAIKVDNSNILKIIEDNIHLDYFLIMTTTPGKSGGKFNKKSFEVIRKIKQRFPKINFQIDGGINHEIAFILKILGINEFVIGSYLTSDDKIISSILNLRQKSVKSNYIVNDYMNGLDEIPIINNKSNGLELIETMDKYKIGAVFVINNQNKLIGIITNAEIRKALINQKFSLDRNIDDIINKNPFFIYQNITTTDMLNYISKIDIPLLVLPIVDQDNSLMGALSFHNLIKYY